MLENLKKYSCFGMRTSLVKKFQALTKVIFLSVTFIIVFEKNG
jgi:hypothetical protein